MFAHVKTTINKLNPKTFLQLNLVAYKDNRNAIGTKVFIYKDNGLNDQSQLLFYYELNAGSGYGSMSSLYKPIHLPQHHFVDIKIVFPSHVS